MQDKQKLLVIVGPTASGKSELAVFLAKYIKKHKLGGFKGAEIISADSRQVYKFLDVGTNKVPGRWQNFGKFRTPSFRNFVYKNIPHHCIDFVHPKKTYSVAEYQRCAKKAIVEIVKRGNIPIIVGGTGFYIKAVVDDLELPLVPPNSELRKKLEKKSTEVLLGMLLRLDPERAKRIDSKNPRRLIRAIEIVQATKKPVQLLKENMHKNVLMLGLHKSKEKLKKAIEQRSKKMIHGLIKEIQLLKKLKVSQKRIHALGFEYNINFGSSVSEIKKMLTRENLRYAKRQMTWFKRDKRIRWIEEKKDALELVRAFLKN
ncbi:MAG: tRNA dimethylallyltransferase [Parcubacteria group bacterium Gr01-1014_70]|nr:MAG: tRNA dimethylallyltransferase [Parcubacteria group bacterium Gr01-1014_70]